MTASPQTRNYLYGKGELFFRAVGSEGYDHLGNAPAFTISLTEEKLEHFSSMSGTKTKDLQLVTQKGATVAFTLEEFTTGNILRAFKGAAVAKQMQAAATVSGQSVSANKGLYTFVGKEKLGFTRLEHGTVAGGTFAPGSSVVGSTSSATATVAYVTDGVLECVTCGGLLCPARRSPPLQSKPRYRGSPASPMWCSRTRPARRPSATARASTTISTPAPDCCASANPAPPTRCS